MRDPFTGEDFRRDEASSIEALKRRFKTEWGLMDMIGVEVRRLSGWDPGRVGQGKRKLVKAAKNS